MTSLQARRWAALFVGLLHFGLATAADALPTVVVAPHAVAQGLSVDGVVEAVTQSTVAARVAGRIVELRVDAGQAVARGDVLVRIDAREAGEAVAAARSQLVVAEAQYQRSRQLRGQNFISPAALDRARADYDAARAAAAQSAVGLDHATVTSPMAGIIARRHAEIGEMATPGQPLLTVYDPAALRIAATIPQHWLSAVRGVREAQVDFPALGRRLAASTVTLLPTADATTHVTVARIALPVSDGLAPGMSARVTFVTGRVEKTAVPLRAVVRRGELRAVYVLDGEALSLRQLRLGESYGDEVEVLAGLRAGEKVVTDPVAAAIRLKAGR